MMVRHRIVEWCDMSANFQNVEMVGYMKVRTANKFDVAKIDTDM